MRKAFSKKYLPCFVLIALWPAALALRAFCAVNPALTERFYSRGLYPLLSGVTGFFSGLVPFCVTEVLLFSVLAGLIASLVLLVVRRVRRRKTRAGSAIKGRALLGAGKAVLCLAALSGAVYFGFTVIWGLNYCRQPMAKNLGYPGGNITETVLKSVVKSEIAQVNALCGGVRYRAGHSVYPGGFSKISSQAAQGYKALARRNALFDGNTPHPKPVLCSQLMSMTGIAGIYIPFTCEPCLNTQDPDFMLAFNAAHESAHYLGFAREDEANFAAYLADSANSDRYFRYSAHLAAFLYAGSALYDTDTKAYEALVKTLDRRAARDLQYYFDYVQSCSGPVEQLATRVNNSYLRAQGQQGVISYSLFVNLLCEKYEAEK